MNFIKKVFDGMVDESVHLQFQKFSKGEFLNRAMIHVKKTGNKFTIKTSAEFANEMVRAVAEKLNGSVKVTGAIVSTLDLDIEYKDKKQFQGVKRYIIDKEMSKEEILGLLDEFPKNFFALSFEASDSKLKIKPKAPKSGKPGKGADEPKIDFCKLVTTDAEFGKSFVFEKPDFKEALIKHNYYITDMIMPEGEKDFAKIREMAKRKGKIVRIAVIDGVETKKEIGFKA